jgi:hypothetical protein
MMLFIQGVCVGMLDLNAKLVSHCRTLSKKLSDRDRTQAERCRANILKQAGGFFKNLRKALEHWKVPQMSYARYAAVLQDPPRGETTMVKK